MKKDETHTSQTEDPYQKAARGLSDVGVTLAGVLFTCEKPALLDILPNSDVLDLAEYLQNWMTEHGKKKTKPKEWDAIKKIVTYNLLEKGTGYSNFGINLDSTSRAVNLICDMIQGELESELGVFS